MYHISYAAAYTTIQIGEQFQEKLYFYSYINNNNNINKKTSGILDDRYL